MRSELRHLILATRRTLTDMRYAPNNTICGYLITAKALQEWTYLCLFTKHIGRSEPSKMTNAGIAQNNATKGEPPPKKKTTCFGVSRFWKHAVKYLHFAILQDQLPLLRGKGKPTGNQTSLGVPYRPPLHLSPILRSSKPGKLIDLKQESHFPPRTWMSVLVSEWLVVFCKNQKNETKTGAGEALILLAFPP